MNSNSLVIQQKQKQKNKYLYKKIEFQNSIVRLSFCAAYRISEIDIIIDIKYNGYQNCLNKSLKS